MWTEFWAFLTPPPPLWTILLNKAYVVIWTFGKPPLPPAMSTWFMNDPSQGFNRVLSMQMPLRSGNRLSFVSLLEKSKGRMDRIAREIKPHRKSDLLLFLKSTFKDYGFHKSKNNTM